MFLVVSFRFAFLLFFLCLLEWSRCCFSFLPFWFVLVVFVFFVVFFLCACFFQFLMTIVVFPAIPEFCGLLKSESLYLIYASASCFLFCCVCFFVS